MYTGLFLITIIFSIYAQVKVNSTFNKYSKVPNRRGYTGAQVAQHLLAMAGIQDVRVEQVSGSLTDHYDPRAKVLRLSQSVYGSSSVAALGVAAHETGHAIQHDTGYAFLGLRSAVIPISRIGSSVGIPLIFLGLLFSGHTGSLLMYAGIILFAAAVVFTLVTLPVEFDASRRAIQLLGDRNFLDSDELGGAKKVLSAAAMTYVAAAAVAVVNLLRLIGLARSRD